MIDIVYRWISPSAERRDLRRTRDNRELAYSIQSLKFLPEVRNIYVIARGCTNWKGAPSNVIWIVEDDFEEKFDNKIPKDSERVKFIIPLLPDLSEEFILMDDDYYLSKPLTKAYFFEQGKPIWPLKMLNSHCPIPLTKTLLMECLNKIAITDKGCIIMSNGGEVHSTEKLVQRRMRYDPLICMLPYLSGEGKIITKKLDHKLIWNRNFSKHPELFAEILTKPPSTFTVNDNWSQEDKVYETQMVNYDKFRNKLFGITVGDL